MTALSSQRKYRTCAEHYVRGRLAYPDELIQQVVDTTRVGSRDRLLDLGCGPGFLAVAFRPFVREVIGIDPEPEMLAQARAYARQHSVDVSFQQGSSDTLGPQLGSFGIVTMGRSFHWMERKRTLLMLDRLVDAEGCLVLFSDEHLAAPQNDWRTAYESVLVEYGGSDPAFQTRHRSPNWIPNDVFLRDSRFSHLETLSVSRIIRTPVESIVDRALSMSFTTPERLGNQVDEFLRRVRNILEGVAREGVVTEAVEWRALVARSSPSPPAL